MHLDDVVATDHYSCIWISSHVTVSERCAIRYVQNSWRAIARQTLGETEIDIKRCSVHDLRSSVNVAIHLYTIRTIFCIVTVSRCASPQVVAVR